ncbi:hypothetical protein MRX96_017160 [Rhipicephalus microplus]
MLTKPFVFVVVATIFGTKAAEYESVVTYPSHDWKDLHSIEIPLRGHRCLIEEAVLSLVPTLTYAPTLVTSVTSGPPMAIRSHVPSSNYSGPGSETLGEKLNKPFVFVVQLALRAFLVSGGACTVQLLVIINITNVNSTDFPTLDGLPYLQWDNWPHGAVTDTCC